MKKILLIEDDLDMAEIVKLHLEELGHEVEHLSDGRAGLAEALTGKYSVLILDLMLPGITGLDICKEVRRSNLGVAILMLTQKSKELDKVLGLELGADDYLTKPFSILELVARVKALIRRSSTAVTTDLVGESGTLVFGELRIDLEKRKVIRGSTTLALTATEFELLAFLATHPGRPFSRGELLERIWEYNTDAYESTVSTHVNRLRNKVEIDPSKPDLILTVWGVGYRFAEQAELDEAA